MPPGGDVRRICELFGLSVEGALRYTSTLDYSDTGVSGPEHKVVGQLEIEALGGPPRPRAMMAG